MPDLTSNYGFRIPKADGTDLILPDDLRVPITSIDNTIKSTSNTSQTNIDAANASIAALDNRIDAFDQASAPGYTVVTMTNAMTIAANWTMQLATIYRRGKFCHGSFQVTRTTSTIPKNDVNGNVGNVLIGTIAAGYRPVAETGIQPRSVGPIWTGYINSSGSLTVSALVPGWTLPIGEILTCTCSYMIP